MRKVYVDTDYSCTYKLGMGYFYVFTITNLAMVRNFDVISAKFNGYQTSRHRTIEDLNTEMNVAGIYVNRSNTQKWITDLCNYNIDILY